MAQRAAKLKSVLKASRRTADQAQQSFLRAEDTLAAIEERESQRSQRTSQAQADITERMPASRGDRR